MKFFNLNTPHTARFIQSFVSIVITVGMLSACGGGGGDGVGSGGTGIIGSSNGIQTGNVSGFGSVIIEGNKYDDSLAAVTTEIEPGNTSSSTLASIRLGMQVKASFDTSERITGVSVLPAILGKVASVNLNSTGDSLVVAGQTVRLQGSTTSLSAPTVFEGLTGAKDVASGDKLEVHGYFDSDGSVIATRVELLDSSNAVTRLSGIVSGLTATASNQTFKIGGLQVSLAASAKVLPANSVIKNGDRVTIWSNVDIVATTVAGINAQSLNAKVVRIESTNSFTSNNQPWRIAGPISSVDLSAKTLKVDDLNVNFTNATLKNTALVDLQKGVVVRVKGSGNNAIEIEILKAPEKVKIELLGLITDFNSASSFKVRNTLINASAASVIFVNGTKANLGDGVLVELEGSVINGVIVPTVMTLKTAEDNRTQAFVGQVSNYNASTGLFNMLGALAKITNSTAFKTFSGGNATIASFSNGAVVQAKGSFSQGVFLVSEIRLGSNTVQEVKLEGIANNVNLVARTLSLNGITVTWTTSTEIDLLSRLNNGARVVVEGLSNTNNSGVVAATKIQVKDR
jgi:exosome complex RNA-binding protein Csl4